MRNKIPDQHRHRRFGCCGVAVAVGGGVPIEAGGSILGSVAVSGAPGGEADDACARAGLAAIRDDIDF